MNNDEQLIDGLPDPQAAGRFLSQLEETLPAVYSRLAKDRGLLSDVVTLSSFSPLLAATMLQNPDYFWWLGRKRRDSGVRGKDELLESLARFSMTHSQLEPQVLFARFRRRELLRIYLRDIRRLATIAEITEELSNLADAILESALKLARREMDNRFGFPQETDDKGRLRPARFCIAALGKLGSLELNYSSDIDLLYLYSTEGTTSGSGSRGAVTNREYFIKVAEFTTRLIGQPAAEGSAYRVDLRLRPHGSLGALTMSVSDTVKYYRTEARAWERQVMIRSRGCAGDIELFSEFFGAVEPLVFGSDENIEQALSNVRLSKEKIDRENVGRPGYNVKLGPGGIREIEFLAQALQLAYGGRDPWLRDSHTLIALARLADRRLISEAELSELSAAYDYLRRAEHALQMENGLQTHTVPDAPEKRVVFARKMSFAAGGDLDRDLAVHTGSVGRIFSRIFGEHLTYEAESGIISEPPSSQERARDHLMASIQRSDVDFRATPLELSVVDRLTEVSPRFAGMLAANPQLAAQLPDPNAERTEPDYRSAMIEAVDGAVGLGNRLAAIRQAWSRNLLGIVVADVFEQISIAESKKLQTELAEASVEASLRIVASELRAKYGAEPENMTFAVLALGKMGGRGMDYDSDLDLILAYGGSGGKIAGLTDLEFYSRAAELLVTTLSSMTRDGSLYRVDLRLRPYGSKGMIVSSADAFLTYMRETADIWEMLAYVKLRAVGGDPEVGKKVEDETRRTIHERSRVIDPQTLAVETRRVRLALEEKRSSTRRGSDVDIKYGEGGMLDVYFAMRFLQLRDDVPDDPNDRSTSFMLTRLREKGSLSADLCDAFLNGYTFLSDLDHNLRLTVGRTTRVPFANQHGMEMVAHRMGLGSADDLAEKLALHRIEIRAAYDVVLGN
jgi:[glutamine synthetase] adenylyltransferase / [glutamine synthetase]-adenylyl-L-tyrosine phosphorylase